MFTGIVNNWKVETGIDISKENSGDPDDDVFFENNFGKDKVLPSGPSCNFRGKEVPCFVRWSEHVGGSLLQ